MVGPGTGIAPFRAFLEERVATGAKGQELALLRRPARGHDFLYRRTRSALASRAACSRASTRVLARPGRRRSTCSTACWTQRQELWRWLAEGAHFYVCGDATRMAADVDHALAEVVATHGGFTREDGAAHLKAMAKAGRYQRDVY